MRADHSISTDQSLLNRPWVTAFIRASYWGIWQNDEQIRVAMENSLCFGLYVDGGAYQIGFARVITDGAVVSAVTDVFIREGYRSKGYGKALMQAVLEYAQIRDTICILDCRPENDGFYAGLGFERKRAIMQRNPV